MIIDTADPLQRLIGAITDHALILAAIGTVTMALQELVKSVFDLRLIFNRWRFRKWVRHEAARRQWLALASGGDYAGEARKMTALLIGEIDAANVVFDQPVEKMMGQLQAATNVILDFPYLEDYEEAYRFLVNAPPLPGELKGDAAIWRQYAQRAAAATDELPAGEGRAAAQARARLANLVARKLDAFQNEAQYLWAELNQRIAVLAGGLFLFSLLLYGGKVDPFSALLLSVMGGLIAPFAKDVVSALSGLAVKRS